MSPSTAVEQQPAGITSLQNSKGAEPDDTQLVHARQQIRSASCLYCNRAMAVSQTEGVPSTGSWRAMFLV